ncbi:[NiFe]-hydrogenase assembly chaperone HybE [Halomonas sp. ML-15]|uniref:[NiFe]-hydrogenase assembly chaperone HybE n=1 Tax=Halomonas sp. ML-15 TaxID=2773305 RepID=UPI0017470E87|nr:[NiFe]-hydrogenase assembly chaperone HybE [Halomonas sp. ML-15]MBD3894313.1 [NiFe]-hydrogenase assembly chaperone HybE [Halomonas sp. ML-15]
MQALSVEQYARLQQLARAYQHRCAATIKRHPARNPHLGVDLLCFQPLPDTPDVQELVGALITPISLSLAVVSVTPLALRDDMPRRWLALPGGEYPLEPLALGENDGLWQCPLLDDLSDLASVHEANRLAQHLLERVLSA